MKIPIVVLSAAVLSAVVLSVGCSQSPRPSPSGTKTCTAPRLVPAYVPKGMHRTKAERVGDWSLAWQGPGKKVQLIGNISADFGDDPTVRDAVVRGHAARYGRTGMPNDEIALQWSEPPGCGPDVPYGLVATGISVNDMLKIANSLRPA